MENEPSTTYEILLGFLEYFGIFVASISSVIGITSDYKEKTPNGKERISKGGKIAITLTIVGLLISAGSKFAKDRYESVKEYETKETLDKKELIDKKVKEEMRDMQIKQLIKSIQISNEISNQGKNQNLKLQQLINEQLKSNKYLMNQMLVENYIQSTPFKVEYIIELPLNKNKINMWNNFGLHFECDNKYIDFSDDSFYKARKYIGTSSIIKYRNNQYFLKILYYNTKLNPLDFIEFEEENPSRGKYKFSEYQLKEIDGYTEDNTLRFKIPMDGRTMDNGAFSTKYEKIINFRDMYFNIILKKANSHSFLKPTSGIRGYLLFDNKYQFQLFPFDTLDRENSKNFYWKTFRNDVVKINSTLK